MDTWHKVAKLIELEEEYPIAVKVGGRELALCLVAGTVFAIDDVCSHAFAHLSDGHLEEFEIMCPLHGGSFDVRSGEPVRAPCFTPIVVHQCRVENGEVLVKINADAAGA
jgi:nitrite reductase/ring-hydroxylating ferredoxin subunit